MSARYPGGFITKTPTAPTSLAAPGIWTLDQAMQNQKAGNWPAPPPPNYIEDVFSTWLYTGDGVGGAITNNINLSAYGGMVWTKGRSLGFDNWLLDTARSLSNGPIKSNGISGELGFTYGISSWLTTGYYSTADNAFQNLGTTFVSWTFRKQEKFFDVVTWTGNGTNRTIAHNLGSVPGCILVKRLDTSSGWRVYHRSLTNTEALALNDNGVKTTSSTYWNSTTATSSVFSLGTDGNVNSNTSTYVAYLFAHDAGGFGASGSDNVVSCGTFTTDGSGNATVNLGYEPQWLITKTTGIGDNWYMADIMRGWTTDGAYNYLLADSSGTESSVSNSYRPTATGFVVANGGASRAYIYIAIRRGPMKVPTLGTSVFSPFVGSDTSTITTGFPVDMLFDNKRAGNSNNTVNASRLVGENALITSSTAAETAGLTSATWFQNNTGYLPNALGTGIVAYAYQRAPSFFDVVCYTGLNSYQDLSHNLGVTPEMVIIKNRSNAQDWTVGLRSIVGTGKYLVLNTTAAVASNASYFGGPWTSTYVQIDGNVAPINQSGSNYVMYLFATCAGVSKVGTYTGTATTKQVDCGFTAGSRFVMIKRTDSTGDWYVWDSARGIVAGNDPYLLINSTAAEVTGTDYVDTYNAGFELSSTAPAALNASGGTYIFLAIA